MSANFLVDIFCSVCRWFQNFFTHSNTANIFCTICYFSHQKDCFFFKSFWCFQWIKEVNNLLGFNLAVNKNQKDYRILNRLMLKTSMNVLYVDFIPFFVFRFGQRSYENTKILCNVCLFFIIHLALQTENIVKKIKQPNWRKYKKRSYQNEMKQTIMIQIWFQTSFGHSMSSNSK